MNIATSFERVFPLFYFFCHLVTAWASVDDCVNYTLVFCFRHIAKQLSAGWRGAWGACGLAWVLLRVTSEALVRGVAVVVADAFRQAFGRGGDNDGRLSSANQADSDDRLRQGSGDNNDERRSESSGTDGNANLAWR